MWVTVLDSFSQLQLNGQGNFKEQVFYLECASGNKYTNVGMTTTQCISNCKVPGLLCPPVAIKELYGSGALAARLPATVRPRLCVSSPYLSLKIFCHLQQSMVCIYREILTMSEHVAVQFQEVVTASMAQQPRLLINVRTSENKNHQGHLIP